MSKAISYCYALLDPRKPVKHKNQYKYDSKIRFSHEPFTWVLGAEAAAKNTSKTH